jgi:hypothetical protein
LASSGLARSLQEPRKFLLSAHGPQGPPEARLGSAGPLLPGLASVMDLLPTLRLPLSSGLSHPGRSYVASKQQRVGGEGGPETCLLRSHLSLPPAWISVAPGLHRGRSLMPCRAGEQGLITSLASPAASWVQRLALCPTLRPPHFLASLLPVHHLRGPQSPQARPLSAQHSSFPR